MHLLRYVLMLMIPASLGSPTPQLGVDLRPVGRFFTDYCAGWKLWNKRLCDITAKLDTGMREIGCTRYKDCDQPNGVAQAFRRCVVFALLTKSLNAKDAKATKGLEEHFDLEGKGADAGQQLADQLTLDQLRDVVVDACTLYGDALKKNRNGNGGEGTSI